MSFQNKISISYLDIQEMKNKVRHSTFLLAVISCLTVSHSFSQQPPNRNITDQYRAVHWTIDDNLPSANSNAMYKDVHGFLWIGSGAPGGTQLCRFDGTHFKLYYPDKDKRGSINTGTIFSFKEDSLHNIWMGTERGMSRYDSKADTFTNFSALIKSGEEKWVITPFWATQDEVFCLEPGAAITAFNIHTLARRTLVQLSEKEAPQYDQWNANKSFFEKNSNSIWTYLDGIYGKLLQIFLDGRPPQYYTWPCYDKTNHKHAPELQPRHGAEDIKYDPKRNSVWINSGEGLLRFSLADKRFYRIEASNKLTALKGYDRGVGIDIDKDGRVWLGTYTNGIFVYDPETDQVQPLFTDPYLQQEVGAENLHVYCDPDGIGWISNWNGKGLYELLPFDPLTKRYTANPLKKDSLSNGMISTIIPGSQGKLWMGTADGLNIFDPVTEKFEVLRAKDLPGIKGTAIIPLYIDTLHQIAWLNAGSQETFEKYFGMQMYEMDIRTRICRPIVFKIGTKQIDRFIVSHTLIRPYEDGIIFCEEKNSCVFELKRGSLVANMLIQAKSSNGFGGMVPVEDRYIFLQHGGPIPNSTFEKIKGKWTKISHKLDSLAWADILFVSTDKTYWVSFRDELVHYDKDFIKIKSYNKRSGYFGPALNLVFDDNRNLWFLTEGKKICRLDPVSGIITTLTEKDGYYEQDNYWFAPVRKDQLGNIYFGIGWKTGIGKPGWGLDRIYPERYAATNKAIVYLSSLVINQKPFVPPGGMNDPEEVSLNYKQNTIRIETGIIDFYSKEKGHIRYKLEKNGQAGEWIYPTDHIIRLEDLRPGDYRLVIQASNASSEFIGPEKILMIKISPPFWETWWFRTLAVLALAGTIYGFIQYRSRNLKQRNILLEKKVTERTNELNRSLLELKTTQDQLIHSEKMASLGELTSGIAHEIKNPLNFINNFSEINMDLINEVIEEQIPRLNGTDHSELLSIVKTLQKNSDKINHHGKRVDDIVKSMLQHSRVGNITKEPVNINALCEESLKLAYHGFKAKEKTFNAAFETNFDPGLPKILVIPQDMGRVLLNIINNAFYAVHEKKKKEQPVTTDAEDIESTYRPMVIVSTKKTENKILVIISDNGMGISQKIISKVFQPFFTTKPTGEGTGLGLSMSYDIVTKSHGGELHVKSIEGEGTEFEIILPVQ